MRGRSGFRRGTLNRVGGLVNSSLDTLGLRHKIMEHQALASWDQVVGHHIAASSMAERVRDGVLFVCCKSSMWSNELSLHKRDIIKRLNAAVGRQVIKDIRFTARGFREAAGHGREEEQSTEAKGLETVSLPDGDSESARRVAAGAPADELADKIARAVTTSKRLTEFKRREGWKPCPRCGELHDGEHDVCDNCR